MIYKAFASLKKILKYFAYELICLHYILFKISNKQYHIKEMFPFKSKKTQIPNLSYNWSFPQDNVRYIISECVGENGNIDKELDLDWEVIDRDPQCTLYVNTSQKSIQKILSRISHLSAIPHKHQSESIIFQYKQMLGEALLKSFNGEIFEANQLLDHANLYITERNIEQSRYWQLTIMFFILIGISLLSYFFIYNISTLKIDLKKFLAKEYSTEIKDYSFIFLAFISSIFGIFGAVVSISQRMEKLNISHQSTLKIHFFEILFKITCSIFISLVIMILIISGQFIPKISESIGIYSIMIFAFLGGISERFVSSVFKNSKSINNTIERNDSQ